GDAPRPLVRPRELWIAAHALFAPRFLGRVDDATALFILVAAVAGGRRGRSGDARLPACGPCAARPDLAPRAAGDVAHAAHHGRGRPLSAQRDARRAA